MCSYTDLVRDTLGEGGLSLTLKWTQTMKDCAVQAPTPPSAHVTKKGFPPPPDPFFLDEGEGVRTQNWG